MRCFYSRVRKALGWHWADHKLRIRSILTPILTEPDFIFYFHRCLKSRGEYLRVIFSSNIWRKNVLTSSNFTFTVNMLVLEGFRKCWVKVFLTTEKILIEFFFRNFLFAFFFHFFFLLFFILIFRSNSEYTYTRYREKYFRWETW